MTVSPFPPDNFLFDTHTPLQKEFIERIHTTSTEEALLWLKPAKNDREQTYPRPLVLTCPRDPSVATYRFELSETPTFEVARVLLSETNEATFDNLKIGTTYVWRVNGGEIRSFTTASASPRFIRVDGALNVRDLGGNAIKQGLLYRGSAIDTPFRITPEGERVFSEELGIRTILDLRAEHYGRLHCIFDNIAQIQLPYRPYLEVFEEEHRRGICRIMDLLADENNYPIYFHCMGGADRTGMIALYLRAIVGESDDAIHTDYELTGLSTYGAGAKEGADGFRSRNAPYYTAFLEKLSTYAPGGTIAEAAVAFLLDCGVSQETLDRIAAIIRS